MTISPARASGALPLRQRTVGAPGPIERPPALADRRDLTGRRAAVHVPRDGDGVPAATPATSDGSTYVSVASLSRATRADRLVIARVGINVPIRNGVLEAPIAERVAYRYPGTPWPGGHSNAYLYGHARVGTFLNLKYMRVGDIVQLHLATGATLTRRHLAS